MEVSDKNRMRPTKKRTFSLSAFTIILILTFILAIISHILPTAQFEGEALIDGSGVVGATLSQALLAPILGFADAIDICLFVLILGAFLKVVTKTGAIETGIKVLIKKLKGKELVLIAILMFIFSIGGTTYGMLEETVGFYALLSVAMVAAGMDTLVASATVLLGAGSGVLGSTINPFAVGAAIDALPKDIVVNQGAIIGIGVALWLTSYAICAAFVLAYAKKVINRKGSTFLSLQEQEAMEETYGVKDSKKTEDVKLSGKQKVTLVLFLLTFVFMIIGFIPWGSINVSDTTLRIILWALILVVLIPLLFRLSKAIFSSAKNNKALYSSILCIVFVILLICGFRWLVINKFDGVVPNINSIFEVLTGLPLGDWYFQESTLWFLIMTIVIGFVNRTGENEFVDTFVDGADDMVGVILVIAVARGASVLMTQTHLDNYIIFNAAEALKNMPKVVFGPLNYILHVLLSVLVPSSSGLASLSAPIMGPLAHNIGFSVEATLMGMVAANGLVNLFTPTCGAIMGGLKLARVEFTTWLRWVTKVIICVALVNIIILTVALLIL